MFWLDLAEKISCLKYLELSLSRFYKIFKDCELFKFSKATDLLMGLFFNLEIVFICEFKKNQFVSLSINSKKYEKTHEQF